MNKLTITEFRKLKVPELNEIMPVEILSDGEVIGVFRKPDDKPEVTVTVSPTATLYQDTGETQCPNCKFKYQLPKKDNSPSPFSLQHP